MRKVRFLIIILVIVAALFGGYILNDKINDRNTVQVMNQVGSAGNINLGNKLLAEEIIVRNIAASSSLIVMEAEAEEDIILDDTYFDLSFLRKIKRISFSAEGVYAVDMGITKEDVGIDWDNKRITIVIPYPYLYSVHVNEEKTKYYETETGLLRFGEIKLEPEEYSAIITYVTESISEKLGEPDFMNRAEESAKESVKEILAVMNISDSQNQWDIHIEFK